MIIAEWSFNIPEEKSKELLRFPRDEIEPLWKKHNAVCSVFGCIGKRYFSYQTSDGETRIVEQVRFQTIEDFEVFLEDYENGKEDYQVLNDYEGRFMAANPMFRIYQEL
jgi:hypothetical protein